MTILGDLRASVSPFSASPWRREDNGALWDVGPHALSILVAGLGPVVEVHGEHGRGDAFVLSARHERGGISSVVLSYSLAAGSGRFQADFWGAAGLVTAPPAAPDAKPVDNVSPALVALVESIRSQESARYDARFGAEIVSVLERAELSAIH